MEYNALSARKFRPIVIKDDCRVSWDSERGLTGEIYIIPPE